MIEIKAQNLGHETNTRLTKAGYNYDFGGKVWRARRGDPVAEAFARSISEQPENPLPAAEKPKPGKVPAKAKQKPSVESKPVDKTPEEGVSAPEPGDEVDAQTSDQLFDSLKEGDTIKEVGNRIRRTVVKKNRHSIEVEFTLNGNTVRDKITRKDFNEDFDFHREGATPADPSQALATPEETAKTFVERSAELSHEDSGVILKAAQIVADMKAAGFPVRSLEDPLTALRGIRRKEYTTGSDYLKARQSALDAFNAEVAKIENDNAGLTEHHGGFNIPAAVRRADDLNIAPMQPTSPSGPPVKKPGSFTLSGRKRRDVQLTDLVWSPLSIIDAWGNHLKTGVIERIGGPRGQRVSQTFTRAQSAIHDITTKWNHRVEEIVHNLDIHGKKQGKKRKQVFDEFITLIEKDFRDPDRHGRTPEEQQALDLHDALQGEKRRYILDSQNSLGNNLDPAVWGITEQGYFRRLFQGDIQLFENGQFVGTARTAKEAQAKALDILAQRPNSQVEAAARKAFSGDPTLRVGSAKYWKTVNDLVKQTGLKPDQVSQTLQGVIGRAAAKRKGLGSLRQRKGYTGFSRDYADVMRIDTYQVARSQELSKLNRDIQPDIEWMRKNDLPGLAEYVEGHLSDLWGIPKEWEVQFGRGFTNTPLLRNYVSNAALPFRQLTRFITGFWSAAKLRWNPKATIVNNLQSLTTLWPRVSSADYLKLIIEVNKPSVQRRLAEKGVFSAPTKLEQGGLTHNISKFEILKNPFGHASNINRGMGYLYGESQALAKGLTHDQAHAEGMRWAELTEFNNSEWNAPAFLRTPQGRLFGQFQGFNLKNLENLFAEQGIFDVRNPNIPAAQKFARIAKWSLAQGVTGGIRSAGTIAELVGAYSLVLALKQQLKDRGWGEDEATNVAEALYLGAPALIGMDLSGSLMVFQPPYGQSIYENVGSTLLGPTFGTAITAATNYQRRGPIGIAEAITPYTRMGESLYQVANSSRANMKQPKTTQPAQKAIQSIKIPGIIPKGSGGLGGQIKVGNNQYLELTKFESTMRALGFTPSRQTRYFEEKDFSTAKRNQLLNLMEQEEFAKPRYRNMDPMTMERIRDKFRNTISTRMRKAPPEILIKAVREKQQRRGLIRNWLGR